jgi:peptidoglycan/xylan/chitin deacetylase (PgdA/CDA1 family)
MTRLLSLLLHDVYRDDPSESGFLGAAADRYKLSLDELDAQLAGLARVRHDTPILVEGSAAAGDRSRRRMPFAITVDDGGVSYYTLLADRLEARGWRGHCFVTTGAIGRPQFLDRGQIRELRARGHVVGSHSVSHPRRFSACRFAEMTREWRDSRAALADILGEDVTTASLPGGAFSRRSALAAAEAGLRVLFTSEPATRAVDVGGCAVLGRFIVRAGYPSDFAMRVGRLERAARLNEWIRWNTKKPLKAVLALMVPRRYGVTTPAPR